MYVMSLDYTKFLQNTTSLLKNCFAKDQPHLPDSDIIKIIYESIETFRLWYSSTVLKVDIGPKIYLSFMKNTNQLSSLSLSHKQLLSRTRFHSEPEIPLLKKVWLT